MALTESGMVWAWGSNRSQQCGRKHKSNTSGPDEMPTLVVPFPVPLDIEIAQIAAGRSHSLALTKVSQQVYSWGSSIYGQCGHAVRRSPQPPRLVEGMRDLNIGKIAAGGNHSLALSVGGRLFSWGQQTEGQLGLGPAYLAQPKPRLVSELDFVAIVAGQEWRAQQRNGGSTSIYSLSGPSTGENFESPLKSIPRIVDIFVGPSYSIALSSSGHAYAFGSNDAGQLGLVTPPELPFRENSNPSTAQGSQSSSGNRKEEPNPFQDIHVQTFDSRHNVLLPTRVDQLVESIRIRTVACGPNHVWFLGDQLDGNENTSSLVVGRTLHEVQVEAATEQRLGVTAPALDRRKTSKNYDEINTSDADLAAQSSSDHVVSYNHFPPAMKSSPRQGDISDVATIESKKEEDKSENMTSPLSARQLVSSSVPVSPLDRESPRGPRAVISRLSLKLRRRLGGGSSSNNKGSNDLTATISGTPDIPPQRDQQGRRFVRRTKRNTL